MIRSEIQQLDTLISSFQSPKNSIGDDHYLEAVTKQCEAVKERWVKRLFSNASDATLTRYIQYHQAGITSLSNHVWRLSLHTGQSATYGEAVVARLEALIDFLRDKFYRYFDKRHPMSLARWQSVAETLDSQLKNTLVFLRDKRADAALVDAIENAVRQKLEGAAYDPVSFQQSDQLLSVLKKLRTLFETEPEAFNGAAAQELHRQNFNSHYFTLWHRQYLAGQFEQLDGALRTATIVHETNLLDHIVADADKAIDADLPASNEQVLRWLRKLVAAEPVQTAVKSTPARLPLFCSVPQFAFFVRLCYLEGCFPVQPISVVIRFFSGHFETKKQSHISLKSFGHAFYGVDQGTAAVVRDLLQRMINLINKTYFP